MIASLNGIIEEISSDHVILSVGGIGYIVYLSSKALSVCNIGNTIKLFIETYSNSRENTSQLYGFVDKEEQLCLRLLIKVNGVSYKTAISILSKLTPEQLFSAIINEDKILLKMSGLGSRLITRIITELYDKVSKLNISKSNYPIKEDAVLALVNLGYEKVRAYEVVRGIQDKSPELDIQDIIRMALRTL
ncbi:Holliday junction branch migration protein RuvA [Wolbachia endosymbiont of Pentidionis agamae]|uniref:Holliday junction branch migration protein RuvA n=1 Tax=Wolbachia endosymbiont of Pentidionis agamae TaxID=3110435 RepID=UPI002FCF4364